MKSLPFGTMHDALTNLITMKETPIKSVSSSKNPYALEVLTLNIGRVFTLNTKQVPVVFDGRSKLRIL